MMRFTGSVLAKLYVLFVFVFLVIRLIFIIYNAGVFEHASLSDWISGFWWGLRYDLIVTSYVLSLVFILLLLYDITRKTFFKISAFYWAFLSGILVFMLTLGDIVYYNHFASRLNNKVFKWLDTPDMILGMIVEDYRFFYFFIPFLFFVFLFFKILKRAFKSSEASVSSSGRGVKITGYVLMVLLMFLLMRGRINHRPVGIRDIFMHGARLTSIQEFKLNPVFSLIKSWEKKKRLSGSVLDLTDKSLAIARVKSFLQIPDSTGYKSPIARKITFDEPPKEMNVVIVLLESMGAWKMKYFGNDENRTPFLDSLFLRSVSFTNFYSNGIHTYGGMYGTTHAYPLIFDIHPFELPNKTYNDISYALKKHGYFNMMFVPHDLVFDNIGIFYGNSSFDKIYSTADYPDEALKTSMGTDDRFVYQFALDKMDRQHARGRKFFSFIITITDHSPYSIPDSIQGETQKIRATRYADMSLSMFFEEARKRPWYDNTLFILLGDHGETKNKIYGIPVTYVHVPMLIYHEGITPKIIDGFGSQMDVFPTLMAYLKLDYLANHFGIDLLSRTRPYAFFSGDEKDGILDNEYFMIMDREEILGLYKYKERDPKNYKDQLPHIADSMSVFLKAHLQTAHYILKNNLQFEPDTTSKYGGK